MEEISNSNQAGSSKQRCNNTVKNPQRVRHLLVVGFVSTVTIGTSATTGYLVAGNVGAVAGAVMGAFIGRFGGNAVVELIESDRHNRNVAGSKTIPEHRDSHPRHREVF